MKFPFLFLFLFFCIAYADDFSKGEQQLLDKKYKEAESTYRKILENDPDNRDARYQLGKALYYQKEYFAAEKEFSYCLELNPEDLDAKFFLGYCFYWQNNYLDAEKAWKEVIEEAPEYVDAYIALSRLYNDIGETENSEKMIERAERTSPNSSQILLLRAQDLQAHGQFKEAYFKFKNIASQGQYLSVRKQLTTLKPYVYPSLTVKGFYDKETEQDLILKIDTTRIRAYSVFAKIDLPLANWLSLNASYQTLPYLQYNLLRELSNFKVNNYYWDWGAHFYFLNTYDLIFNAKLVKGRDDSSDIFPFQNKSIWEPKFVFRYHPDMHLISFAAFKDEFIARDFTVASSFYVKREVLDFSYEYRFLPKYYGIGAQGSYQWYKGDQTNKKKEASSWFRFQIPWILRGLLHVHYLAKYDNFSFVDDDYFSFRRRWQQRATLSLFYEWEDRGSIDFSYEYSWQRVRDFNNINEAITTSINPPQFLQLNLIQGDTFQFIAKKTIGDSFHFEGKIKYYTDSDSYKAFYWELALRSVF